MGVHALNDDGALLQSVAGVAAELHGGPHRVRGCTAAEVAVFDKGLVAMALLEGCKPQDPAQLSAMGANTRQSSYFPPQGFSLPDNRCVSGFGAGGGAAQSIYPQEAIAIVFSSAEFVLSTQKALNTCLVFCVFFNILRNTCTHE